LSVNKWSDSFSDLESIKLHTPATKIGKAEGVPTRKHGEISLSDKQFLYAAQRGTMEFRLLGAWDSGISGSCMLRENEGGMWKLLQQAVDVNMVIWHVRMQWDPDIITATTWGQVVFRAAGNVMTRIWPKISLLAKLQSSPAKAQASSIQVPVGKWRRHQRNQKSKTDRASPFPRRRQRSHVPVSLVGGGHRSPYW
jgi:hypothetical protein